MRRPVWFRVLIALWGVWFSTALVEPAGLLACPMHSGMAGVTATHADPSAHAGHETHGGGAANAARGDAVHSHGNGVLDASSHETPAPEGQHNCTCLGQCCTMALDASIKAAEELLPSARVVSGDAPLPALVAHIVTPVEHVRPFANGPPVTIA